MFVHRHSDGKEQFDLAMNAVRGSSDLVALGKDGRGEDRFTSRQMIETEQRLGRASELLAERERHQVEDHGREVALARASERGLMLSGEQRAAFEHVTDNRGLSVVVGYAGTGKSAMLGVAREAWESAGYTVRGAALSGIAAEGLEHGSGIAPRTIASLEHQWGQGRKLLTARDVLVIDKAGMVGTRQMERASPMPPMPARRSYWLATCSSSNRHGPVGETQCIPIWMRWNRPWTLSRSPSRKPTRPPRIPLAIPPPRRLPALKVNWP